MNAVVVHYKELALKGRNRPWFVRMLVKNLRSALSGLEIVAVRSLMGRIEIEFGARSSWDEIRDRVRLLEHHAGEPEARRRLRSEMLRAERRILVRLRNEGAISDDVLRELELELDLEAVRVGAGEDR